MPPGFHLLIAAQFASALADNALLIVAMAWLDEQGRPAWWAPLLKFSFTLSYVLLAPFIGPLADALPKARLMAWMNGVKMLGVLALFAGMHPVAAYGLVGLGAATYAPAKYGLVTEMVPAHRLVAANGWIEVSVVCAALLGTVLGGALVSDLWRGAVQALGHPLMASLAAVWLVYALAALLQIGVPDSGARYPGTSIRPMDLVRDFAAANRRLWRDTQGGLSLAVTTLFWGVGATLQFAVLRWAVERLGLGLDRAAYLQAMVAVGVVAGAAAAGRFVPLAQAWRVLPAGILMGGLIVAMAPLERVGPALPLLALAGIVGGILVVPMNALLQHRGHVLLTAGRSIAVQGFNENLSILLMLGSYASLLALQVPLVPLMMGFGGLIAAAMALLIWRRSGALRTPAGT
jgi:LPLT family lysophospholipid transporter-like MFS transporter